MVFPQNTRLYALFIPANAFASRAAHSSFMPQVGRFHFKMTTCRLCKRECAKSSVLCKFHLIAKSNLESGYRVWAEAYGSITMKEYLQRIGRNKESGQWVKEVAELLAKESVDQPPPA